MPNRDRRAAAEALSTLEKLLEQMETLGHKAEDAAARVTAALNTVPTAEQRSDQHQLCEAIGDVIEIATERSRLAHQAHRVITELRRRESEARGQSREND